MSQPKNTSAGKQPVEDDEWNFSSALPESSTQQQQQLPREHRATITDGSIRAEYLANRTTASSPAIDMLFSFSNNTAQPISELHFQLAVTKVSFQSKERFESEGKEEANEEPNRATNSN